MPATVRALEQEEVGAFAESSVGIESEKTTSVTEVIQQEVLQTEPLLHPCRATVLPLSTHPIKVQDCPPEHIRVHQGVIVPATTVILTSSVFLFALWATAYFTAGLLACLPSLIMLRTGIYLSLVSIFFPLTLFSLDWVRRSINDMALGTEEVVTAPYLLRNVLRTKSHYCKLFLWSSVAYAFLGYVGFCLAIFRTVQSISANLFIGWFCVALGTLCMAVYLDLKRVNPDESP